MQLAELASDHLQVGKWKPRKEVVASKGGRVQVRLGLEPGVLGRPAEPGGGVEQAGAPKGDQEGHLPHPPFSTNESLLRSERGRG